MFQTESKYIFNAFKSKQVTKNPYIENSILIKIFTNIKKIRGRKSIKSGISLACIFDINGKNVEFMLTFKKEIDGGKS